MSANAIKSALCTCFCGQQERLLSDNALVHQLNFINVVYIFIHLLCKRTVLTLPFLRGTSIDLNSLHHFNTISRRQVMRIKKTIDEDMWSSYNILIILPNGQKRNELFNLKSDRVKSSCCRTFIRKIREIHS